MISENHNHFLFLVYLFQNHIFCFENCHEKRRWFLVLVLLYFKLFKTKHAVLLLRLKKLVYLSNKWHILVIRWLVSEFGKWSVNNNGLVPLWNIRYEHCVVIDTIRMTFTFKRLKKTGNIWHEMLSSLNFCYSSHISKYHMFDEWAL